ncbi:MAG: YkgJ family cysteine cluster protein [Brumimicrobium sp.]
MEYQAHINRATAQNKSNKKLIQQLRKLSGKKLDNHFRQEHNSVFEEIDCLKCANCCKTTSPIFRDIDIERLSKRLRINATQFVDKYLFLDSDNDYVLKSSPCVFLLDDNKCSVYEDRPLACKEYPHTDRKKMHQILKLTLENTQVCPAVAKIFDNLKLNIK